MVVHNDVNGGIAAATNRRSGSPRASSSRSSTTTTSSHPDALLECVRLLNDEPETDAIYTDEDKIDRRGRRSDAFFKPDWSPELFRGVMYVGHLLVLRRSLVESVGGLDSSFDGVQDYELMLRISERTDRIEHVPKVLYHWRKLPQSVASSTRREGRHLRPAGCGDQRVTSSAADRRAFARPNPDFPHRVKLHPKPRARWPRRP